VANFLFERERVRVLEGLPLNKAWVGMDDLCVATRSETHVEAVEKALERLADDLRCYPFDGTVLRRKAYAAELRKRNAWHEGYPSTIRILGPLSKHRGGRPGRYGLRATFPEDDALSLLPPEIPEAPTDLEDIAAPFRYSQVGFSEFLDGYSDQLPREQRSERILELLGRAWQETIFQPTQAAHVLDNPPRSASLASVIRPLARAALRQPIPDDELLDLVAVVDSIGTYRRLSTDVARQVNHFYARLFRQLAFMQPEGLSVPKIHTLLRRFANSGHGFWERFFADLHLRLVCGPLALDADIQNVIAIGTIGYRKRIAQTPLEKAWEAVVSPLEFVRTREYEKAYELLSSAARSAMRPFEAHITLLAFDRVLPLYDQSTVRPEESEAIVRFFNAIPRALIDRSTRLQHALLTRLLWSFIRDRNRNFERLREFERRYGTYCAGLNPLQRLHIQLEYAAALFVAFQSSGFRRTQQLDFTKLLDKRTSLLDSPGFANEFVRWGGLDPRPATTDDRSIRTWLENYCGKLLRQYCLPILKREPLHLAAFKAAAELPVHRSSVADVVGGALARSLPNASPAYSAYSLSLMPLAGRKLDSKLRQDTTIRAISADEYTLKRTATFVAESLWRLSFYAPDVVTKLVTDEFFAKVLTDKRPRFIWLYQGAIAYPKLPHDVEYLDVLWRKCAASIPDHGTASRVADESEVFSSEVRRVSREHSGRSRLATAAVEFLTDSDAWGILARTVERWVQEPSDFEKAAFLYNVAAFLGRQHRRGTSRLQFAALRCRCLAMLRGAPIDEQYLINASRFVANAHARDSREMREFVNNFSHLLDQVWGHVSPNARQTISALLANDTMINVSSFGKASVSGQIAAIRNAYLSLDPLSCRWCEREFTLTESEWSLYADGEEWRLLVCRNCCNELTPKVTNDTNVGIDTQTGTCDRCGAPLDSSTSPPGKTLRCPYCKIGCKIGPPVAS